MKDKELCQICGRGSEADHSGCLIIAMERSQPCEHDNIRITLAGLRICNECGQIAPDKGKDK